MREPHKRLGRGLASLLGDARAVGSDPAAGDIALRTLEPGAFQPRAAIQLDSLADLAASISVQGVLQPLLVRPHPTDPGRYQIVAGERRWRAAQQVGLTVIPCLIRTLTDSDATAAALVENLQRVDLNAIEEAEGFRRLIEEFSLTQEELGRAIGKSRSHVANVLRLLNLPIAVAELVRSGALTAGHARAALACPDPTAAAELMQARGLSVREAEALSQSSGPPRPTKPQRPPASSTPDLRAVEADLSGILGMNVKITHEGRGGTLKVTYRTLDQLDHIIARLGRS